MNNSLMKLSFIIFALLSLESCVSFRAKIGAIPPSIKEGQLANGLRFYVMPHHFPKNRCFLRFNINVGSFYEKDDELGMAHLLEHLAFENRVMGEDKELAVWFQEQGMSFGPDANAFTTTDHTVYHVNLTNCEEQSIKDALTIFRSFLDGIEFNDEKITKQKQIVDQEEAQHKNSISKLGETISKKLYDGTLFASRHVLGKKSIRDTFTKEKLAQFYHRWYSANNAQVIVVGAVDPLMAEQHIRSLFNDARKASPIPPLDRGHPSYQEPVFIVHEPQVKSIETIFLLQPKGFTSAPLTYDSLKQRLIFELVSSMLQESISKKSAKQQTDELVPTEFYAAINDFQSPELSIRIATTLESQESVFKRAFAPLRRALDHGFSNEQLKRAKDNKIDDLERATVAEATTSSSHWADIILSYVNQRDLLLDAKTTADISKDIIKSISAADCHIALNNAITNSNTYLFSFGNIEDNDINKTKLKELLNYALNTKGKELSNKTKEEKQFLYKTSNISTASVTKEYFEPIDTSLFTFANNFRLVAKNSSLQKDTILIELANQHGQASMSAKDVAILEIVSSAFFTGGLKKHSWKEIIELTRDKVLRLWPQSSMEHLGMRAVTRPADLRFTLELMRAFITDAEFSEEAITQAKNKAKLIREEGAHSINWPLETDFPRILTHNDKRAYRASLADIQAITRADVLDWYRKWITHEQLTLTVLGDYDASTLINDVASVFSMLPKESVTRSHARAVVFSPGIHKTYTLDTTTKTAKIILRFPLNIATKTKENRFLLPLASTIIQEQLRLTLREEQKALYAPQVSASANPSGLMQNTLDIVLSPEHTSATKVRDEALKVISALAQKGVNQTQLSLAQKTLLDNLLKRDEMINYWFDVLTTNTNSLASVLVPKEMPALLEKISLHDINTYLKKYFSSKNYSSAIINGIPKKSKKKR